MNLNGTLKHFSPYSELRKQCVRSDAMSMLCLYAYCVLLIKCGNSMYKVDTVTSKVHGSCHSYMLLSSNVF